METNANDPLRQQLSIMRNSLFDEKILDEQYRVLEDLEDSLTPNFAEDTMNNFFENSADKIAIFEQALEKPPSDFSEVKRHLAIFRGSSMSVGANKLRIETEKLIECIEQSDMERAKIMLQQIKKERDILALRLESYFKLLRQVEPSRRLRSDLNK